MSELFNFNFNTTPNIRFGSNILLSSAAEIKKILGPRILIVTDPLLSKMGLYKPLVDEFGFGNDKDRVINTIEYINELYGDTNPKGNNWKVWYYLAWAKYRAERLKILDKVRISKYLNRRILEQDYQNDMEEAKKKGYQPQGRHSAFPTIERGDLAAGILNRIEAAKGKFSKGNVIAAEEDFLAIKDDTEKNDPTLSDAFKIKYHRNKKNSHLIIPSDE